MSGHSKWAGIKHKKAIVDAKRGSSFTRLGNAVTVAAKQGGGDLSMNPALRTAVDKARAANMPKDTIERAIQRGTGELGGAVVEEVLYEGFGPGGAAVLVEAVTDNRNRTNTDVRTLFNKLGGRMPEGGGLAYQFQQTGVIRCEIAADQSDLFERTVIEGGARDYQLGADYAIVYTDSGDLHPLKDALESVGVAVRSAKLERISSQPIEIDESSMEKLSTLLTSLEDHDDVTAVYTNLVE
jgi:YebC/PmpR family DNA-binding regulatory protein